jgi:hypothetical protein
MIQDDMKPLVFALADAIETDLSPGAQGRHCFAGSRKAILELFEGYSPTIISSIEDSLYDPGNRVAAVDQHIFGNVGAITLVEGQQSTVHCFVYDRSKRIEGTMPWNNFWSRKDLYKWLELPVKAIYHRSIFDTEWSELPNGRNRVHEYCKARSRGDKARDAYNAMWDVSPAQLEGQL